MEKNYSAHPNSVKKSFTKSKDSQTTAEAPLEFVFTSKDIS